jgi:predicted amidohydrolase
MKISIAQIRPIKGELIKNVCTHKKIIDPAITHKADCIFFPELSLTGYEPELAKALALNQDDIGFEDFQKISADNNITIGVGVLTKQFQAYKSV